MNKEKVPKKGLTGKRKYSIITVMKVNDMSAAGSPSRESGAFCIVGIPCPHCKMLEKAARKEFYG
ncbi:MAG: hypothetical protein IKJ35_02735 [Clostridia bacterium]|nr:hypothetical protein [Clostridia bacterium]